MSRRVVVSIGALAAVVIALVLILGGSDGYVVRAEFKDVGGLRKNSSVKIAGVPGGKVIKLDVTGRDTAIAHLRLDDNAAPIGTGASVAVRPTDLLGERYAELSPGDVSRPQPSGSVIPIRRTSVPVELDDIFNVLDPDARTRLGILINEVGMGLNGRGRDLNKTLAAMPPNLGQARKLLAEVASQNVTLKSMIAKGDAITATVNAKRDDMGALVDQASTALDTVAQKRHELGRTIQNAPGALRELRTALGHIDSASVALRPFARELRTAAGPLNETLRTLPSFSAAATPTLRTAIQVAPALTRLGRRATPTIRRLQPTAALLADTLRPARAITDQLDVRATDDILYFLNNWAGGMQGRDSLGHFVGAKLNIDSSYVTNAVAALNPEPALPGRRRKRPKPSRKPGVTLPDLPVKPLPKPRLPKLPDVDVPGEVDDVLDRVDDVVGGLLEGQRSGGGGTSGGGDSLRLFDYLMGP